MKHETIAKISAVIITIALVAILLSQIQIADIITTLADIDPLYLVAGFVLYVCSYFFRALRFHILLNREVKLRDLFNIVCVHNLVNKIFPARTGELSYIYLLKKLHNKTTGEGIATLFVARVFDFIVIAISLFISALSLEKLPNLVVNVIWIIAVCMVLAGVTLVGFIYFDERFMRIIKKITIKTNIVRFGMVQYLLRKADETVNSFGSIKSKYILVQTGAVSIGIWASMYLVYSLLVYAFGINLSTFEVITIVSFVALLPLLPFYAVGGFGTTEATITVVMISFGVLKETAIVASFGMHIIGIIYTLIVGAYGLLILNLKNYISLSVPRNRQ